MNLYDNAVELDLKLKATQSADSNLELVAKAEDFVDAIDEASGCLASVVTFKSRNSITNSPPIDEKAVTAAVRAFRAGLSAHGPKAFQQQPAAKLIEVAKVHRAGSTRWVATQWKARFEPFQQLLEEAKPGRLTGSSAHRRSVERLERKMSLLQRQSPIADMDKIIEELCDGDVNASWRDHLDGLAEELRRALELLKEERDALTPEVQSALASASSDEGLSLEDLTADVLEKLHAAGVAGDLVVRRR